MKGIVVIAISFRTRCLIGSLTLLGCVAGHCQAGLKVTLGKSVSAKQRISMDRVDHRTYDALLTKYVDLRGNVDYTLWKRATADVRALDAYINHLSRADRRIRAGRNAQLAFWINAYNAVTIRGILREYPTTSIRNHTAKLYGYNIWKDLLLQVGDGKHSLEQIEHEISRKMGEPRIHFAIVCASRSCPRLLNQAYTAEGLEKQLVENTKVFFASPGNFRHDASNRRFYLSSILKWFADDFGSSQTAQLRKIAPYLPTRQAYNAAAANSVGIKYLSYDWDLNDQRTARNASRR